MNGADARMTRGWAAYTNSYLPKYCRIESFKAEAEVVVDVIVLTSSLKCTVRSEEHPETGGWEFRDFLSSTSKAQAT
jgi:hypothetical protein